MSLINPIAALVGLSLLGFSTIVLNIAALIVLHSIRKRHESGNSSLIWLLFANLLMGLFPIPIYGMKKYNFSSPHIQSKLCDAWRYTYFTVNHFAVVSVLVMTFEKIICLNYPFHYREYLSNLKSNAILATSWLFFIIFDMIPFFPVNEVDDELCHYFIKKEWAVTMNVLTMMIPVPVIIACYAYMLGLAYRQAVLIDRTSIKGEQEHNTSQWNRKIKLALEVKASRKVALIVGSYIVCWLPSTLYYLLEWLCKECYPDNYEPHRTWIRFFFKILVMFHALITPIVFCWYSKIFRKNAHKFVNSVRANSSRRLEASKITFKAVGLVTVIAKTKSATRLHPQNNRGAVISPDSNTCDEEVSCNNSSGLKITPDDSDIIGCNDNLCYQTNPTNLINEETPQPVKDADIIVHYKEEISDEKEANHS